METNDRSFALLDLDDLISTVKEDVEKFSKSLEYSLSANFRDAITAAFPEYAFYFYERTLGVGTPAGQFIYVSNQSFALARCLMDYCEEIGKYRNIARDILYRNQEGLRNITGENGKLEDEVFTALRDQKNDILENEFRDMTRAFFCEKCVDNQELVDTNTERLIRFVTDYPWWLGGKQISRSNDWAISPISTLLNMPQNDSNFVARAVSKATEDSDYREAFKQAIEQEWTTSDEASHQLIYKTGLKSDFERNRILFGAPGTGKSFTIDNDMRKLLGADNEKDYERVTFHPDYSYASFVGTYKPVMVENKSFMLKDKHVEYVVSVLNDKSMSAQDKYDLLFETFREDGLTRLPILLGLYTDEIFKTKKNDGSDAANDNSVERNHGRAIRKYVAPLTGNEKCGDIAYEYVPGPFMRVYVEALRNAQTGNPRPFLLIIEEINRANIAAVFGDIFQLLDREDNISEYPIQASEDMKKYLSKELGGKPDDYSRIRIPDNMFIWATMNSADQGVFPMDTAFKRRWNFTYLGIDDNDENIRGKFVVVGSKEKQRVEWNSLRKAINEFLAEEKINEDKQLGPYFISKSIVVPADGGTEIDSEDFCDVFKHKVLMYLFEDAARQKRAKIFEGSAKGQNRYSKICEAFDEQGIGIFHYDIQTKVIVQDLCTNENKLGKNGLIIDEDGTSV